MDVAAILAENKLLKEQVSLFEKRCSLQEQEAKLLEENLNLKSQLVDKYAQQMDQYAQKVLMLQDQIAQLQRIIFGRKSERFVYQDNQLNLFGNGELEVSEVPQLVETTIPTHTRKINKNHPGRSLLKNCSHLRVEEQLIETPHNEEDLLIGHLQREKLAYKPGEFFIKKLITPKYKNQESGKIVVGEQPSEPIPKCEADLSLLTYIVVSKFVDHLPEYRLQKIFKRDGVVIPPSTMNGWTHKIANLFTPMADYIQQQILSTGYIQMDESTIRVLDTKKGKSHLGYMWVIYSPSIRCVNFIYHKGRSKEAPTEILENFKGKLQSDGYQVYETINNQRGDIDLSNCNAHARRKFEAALSNNKNSANKVMRMYQNLYAKESKINEKRNDFDNRELFYAYRKEERKVMEDEIKELKDFIHNPPATVLPKSLMGKAIMYTRNRWEKLTKFVSDGELEMDTNFIENCIRPLALGRKNYLFAGNSAAATNIGVFYSVFNTCRHLQINVMDYTTWYLQSIGNTKINEIEALSPMTYKILFP